MRGGVLTMRLYLLTIICLGTVQYEVRADDGGCNAIVHAWDRYPQACTVSAICLRGWP